LGGAAALAAYWSRRYADALPKGWTLLAVLASLLTGGLIGWALKIEDRLEGLGERLRIRFKAHHESPFIEGFLSASLLFAIGPLAILGSISDGMSNGIDQLLLKSSLDFFAAMAFAASLGWGVAASAIPVGIYQGFWTIVGLLLGSILAGFPSGRHDGSWRSDVARYWPAPLTNSRNCGRKPPPSTRNRTTVCGSAPFY
jgi:hypothetical protein